MGHIKAGNPARSRRLASVLEFLKKRGAEGATTREIIEVCEVCAVNSIVAELRACGHAISCRTRVADTGARIARYVLVTNVIHEQPA